jgi:hypothetical protein
MRPVLGDGDLVVGLVNILRANRQRIAIPAGQVIRSPTSPVVYRGCR